jgi:hypothetical protein
LRGNDRGLWKVGDEHVADLEEISKNDPRKYNLLSEADFAQALDKLRKE